MPYWFSPQYFWSPRIENSLLLKLKASLANKWDVLIMWRQRITRKKLQCFVLYYVCSSGACLSFLLLFIFSLLCHISFAVSFPSGWELIKFSSRHSVTWFIHSLHILFFPLRTHFVFNFNESQRQRMSKSEDYFSHKWYSVHLLNRFIYYLFICCCCCVVFFLTLNTHAVHSWIEANWI